MGLFGSAKKATVKIAEDDLNDAKLSSIDFQTEEIRKRAFINVLGARLAMKYFFSEKIQANNIYSLYTIHNILESIDIADIYFKNVKIDVRLIFNENEIFIPKSHFTNNILPDIYAVFILKEDLSSAEFLGYFEPSSLDKTNQNKDFYFIEKENLAAVGDFKKFLEKFEGKTQVEVFEEDATHVENLFLSAIDKTITQEEKLFLYKTLSASVSLREKFVEFENFELISSKVKGDESILKDSFLDIVGAQKVFEEDMAELEETIEAEQVLETIDEEEPFSGDLEEPEIIEEPIEEELEIVEDSLELDEIEPLNENEEKEDSNLGASIAEGAIIAGGVALAGGAVAASISHIADDVSKNVISETLDTIGSLGEAVIEKIPDIDLEETGSKKLEAEEIELEEIEIEKTQPLEDLGELEEFEPQEEISEAKTDEIEAFEEPVVEEFEILDEEDDLENLESILEQELSESEIPPEAVFEELSDENIEVMDIKSEEETNVLDETSELLEEIDDFEIDSGMANQFNTLSELNELPALEEVKAEQDEDVVNLENFDFEMFDEEKISLDAQKPAEKKRIGLLKDYDETSEETKTEEEVEFKTETEDELEKDFNEPKEENVISFESFLENDLIKVESRETDFEEVNFGEKNDEEIENKDDDTDISSLASKVDQFLSSADLSDIEKNILAGEFSLEGMQEETAANMPAAETFAVTPEQNLMPEIDLNDDIDMLNSAKSTQDKELLNSLFEKENLKNIEALENGEKVKNPTIEILEKIWQDPAKKKKVIIAAAVAGVMVVAITASSLKQPNNMTNLPQNQPITANAPGQPPAGVDTSLDTALTGAVPQSMTPQGIPPQAPTDMQNPPQAIQSQPAKDMGQAMSEAFMSGPASVTVSKVAWEVPEDLAYNDVFRKYLQTAGKNLKLTLKNDLLLSTEVPYSNKVIVDLKLGKDGSVQASNIITSSGSKQIDGIVLQSVKETLKYLKMPAGEVSESSVNATLIINF